MDSDYKLHVKLGAAEFNGEGPESAVKEAYQQFLETLPLLQNTPANKPNRQDDPSVFYVPDGVDEKLLERAFRRDEDIVSLRHLPPADRANRNADAAILILYGFKKLLNQDDVPVTRLNEALRTSGITMQRVDRFIVAHSHLYRRGGTRSGGRYALNNQGEGQAEEWLKQWFN